MATAKNENKIPKVGIQQFPETVSVIPDEKEMAERVCLSLNLKDGQKSVGQSLQDPYTQALKYIEEHRIVEVFQVTIATKISSYPQYKKFSLMQFAATHTKAVIPFALITKRLL